MQRQEPRVQFHKVEVPQQSSALWFVLACIFFFLFIITSIICGYYYSKKVRADAMLLIAEYRCEDLASESINLEVADQLSGVAPHFFVVRDRNDYSNLYMVDREKGKEIPIYSNRTDGSDNFSLYAVPQKEYDGHVYVQRMTQYGELTGQIEEIDVLTGKVNKAAFTELFPSARTASSISPDQGAILFLYDNPVANEWEKQAVMIDIVSGDAIIVGSLEESQYYSKYQGDGIQGGASGFDIRWVEGSCASVGVFEDSSYDADADVVKVLKEYQEYCL